MHEHIDGRGVVMVEEEAGLRVERGDGVHLLFAQPEVKDPENPRD
ncbi:MAG: hypothetical protein ACI38B_02940 [Bifidobacterium sp.]